MNGYAKRYHAIVVGVGLGALLAAVSAGIHALGEAGLQALSESNGRSRARSRRRAAHHW